MCSDCRCCRKIRRNLLDIPSSEETGKCLTKRSISEHCYHFCLPKSSCLPPFLSGTNDNKQWFRKHFGIKLNEARPALSTTRALRTPQQYICNRFVVKTNKLPKLKEVEACVKKCPIVYKHFKQKRVTISAIKNKIDRIFRITIK